MLRVTPELGIIEPCLPSPAALAQGKEPESASGDARGRGGLGALTKMENRKTIAFSTFYIAKSQSD